LRVQFCVLFVRSTTGLSHMCIVLFIVVTESYIPVLVHVTHYSISVEHCEWQGFGMFMFLWQFLIPLIIFVFAYWMILRVIRRQAKIDADHRRITVKPTEPVAGPSGGTAETAFNTGSTKDENQRDEGADNNVAMAGTRRRRQAKDQTESTALSKAQINVVKTMIYIAVCFTLCWLPMYVNSIFTRVLVR